MPLLALTYSLVRERADGRLEEGGEALLPEERLENASRGRASARFNVSFLGLFSKDVSGMFFLPFLPSFPPPLFTFINVFASVISGIVFLKKNS